MNLPRPAPARKTIAGRYARLEPLSLDHAAQLYQACRGEKNRDRFRYVFEYPPENQGDIEDWIEQVQTPADPMFFAVIDQASGQCEGRQALMNIFPEFGRIELGSIFWGMAIARTRIATEATYLHLKYAFDELGYRRFEWKCNNDNAASKHAAERFGFTFEGVFRQHLVIKGANRDTAWFSIIDSDWPAIRQAFEDWLAPENFDSDGNQINKLAAHP